jgi:hypothetical protein
MSINIAHPVVKIVRARLGGLGAGYIPCPIFFDPTSAPVGIGSRPVFEGKFSRLSFYIVHVFVGLQCPAA